MPHPTPNYIRKLNFSILPKYTTDGNEATIVPIFVFTCKRTLTDGKVGTYEAE